jgi:hypothetical protein
MQPRTVGFTVTLLSAPIPSLYPETLWLTETLGTKMAEEDFGTTAAVAKKQVL